MKIYEDKGDYFIINFSTISDELEPANYVLKKGLSGFYLSRSKEFQIPKKIYGDVETHIQRYLKAFELSKGNLGIVLNGEKGSGKTLLATLLCQRLNLPVIKIEDKFKGSDFIEFINNIEQKCVILIDEYDKMYTKYSGNNDDDDLKPASQTELLKMMDGGSCSTEHKRMFIFTSNELNISEYMINRPSRIRYRQTFGKMDQDTIVEVLKDKLKYSEYIEDFKELSVMYCGFNLDTLLILIDEVNNFNSSPKELIKFMNIIPESEKYEVFLILKGKEYKAEYAVTMDFTDKDENIPHMYFYTPETDEGKRKVIKEMWSGNLSDYKVTPTKEGLLLEHLTNDIVLLFKPKIIPNYVF